MNRFQQDIELNEDWQPVVGKKSEILSRLLPCMIALSTYLLFLNLGLRLSFLRTSPLVNIVGSVIGFVSLIVCWLVAFFIFGLLGGNFHFANSLFPLIKQSDLRASVAILFTGSFLSGILVDVLRKVRISYSARKILFIGMLIFAFVALMFFLNYIETIHHNKERYVFIYSLLGIIYTFLVGYNYEEKEQTQNRTSGRSRKTGTGKERYSWEDLRDIFQGFS